MRSPSRLALLVVVLGVLVAGVVSAFAIGNEEPERALVEASSAPGPPPTTAPPTTAGPTTSVAPATSESPVPKPSTTVGSTATPRAAPGSSRATRAPTTATTRSAATTPRPTDTTAAAPAPPAGNTAGDALDALNRDRASRGLPALRVRSDLQAKAQAWAERLARENALSHSTLSDGLAPCWTRLGENIAPGSSVTQAEQRLMSDQDHQDNILGRWDWVGVGVARGGGGVIVVQVFMSGCL